jgi:hypothetical protein
VIRAAVGHDVAAREGGAVVGRGERRVHALVLHRRAKEIGHTRVLRQVEDRRRAVCVCGAVALHRACTCCERHTVVLLVAHRTRALEKVERLAVLAAILRHVEEE